MVEYIEQYCGANVMFRKHVADGNEISFWKKISSWCVGTNGSWVLPQPLTLTLEQPPLRTLYTTTQANTKKASNSSEVPM